MMQQLVLDLGLPTGPSLQNFCAGANEAALAHLKLWLGSADLTRRSPVPSYLWGGNVCGKTHLLQAMGTALQEQGSRVGWLDATVQVAPEFDESWACVLMDDVHAFSTAQQQLAFNWFVHAQTLQMAVLASGSLPPADLKLRDDLRLELKRIQQERAQRYQQQLADWEKSKSPSVPLLQRGKRSARRAGVVGRWYLAGEFFST